MADVVAVGTLGAMTAGGCGDTISVGTLGAVMSEGAVEYPPAPGSARRVIPVRLGPKLLPLGVL